MPGLIVNTPYCFSSHLSPLHYFRLSWLFDVLHGSRHLFLLQHLEGTVIGLFLSLIRLGAPWGQELFHLSVYSSAQHSIWHRVSVPKDACWLSCTDFFFSTCWLTLLKSHMSSIKTHLSCDSSSINITRHSWALSGVWVCVYIHMHMFVCIYVCYGIN